MLRAGPIAEVLRSASVSECFGVPVQVTRAGGRFGARATVVARGDGGGRGR